MNAQLLVAEARVRHRITAAKTVITGRDPSSFALLLCHRVQQGEQPPRLRRQLIKRLPKHLMRDPKGIEVDQLFNDPLKRDIELIETTK